MNKSFSVYNIKENFSIEKDYCCSYKIERYWKNNQQIDIIQTLKDGKNNFKAVIYKISSDFVLFYCKCLFLHFYSNWIFLIFVNSILILVLLVSLKI